MCPSLTLLEIYCFQMGMWCAWQIRSRGQGRRHRMLIRFVCLSLSLSRVLLSSSIAFFSSGSLTVAWPSFVLHPLLCAFVHVGACFCVDMCDGVPLPPSLFWRMSPFPSIGSCCFCRLFSFCARRIRMLYSYMCECVLYALPFLFPFCPLKGDRSALGQREDRRLQRLAISALLCSRVGVDCYGAAVSTSSPLILY